MPPRISVAETISNTRELTQKTRRMLEDRYNCLVWVTADQELIPLKVMNTQHLTNIYNMLLCRITTDKTFLETMAKYFDDSSDEELLMDSMNVYDRYESDRKWILAVGKELSRRGESIKSISFPDLYPRSWHIKGRLF